MANPSERTCGNCTNFDIYRSRDTANPDQKRELVGEITIGGDGKVVLGLCRADRGMMLGARPETSNCGLVPSVFSPKEVDLVVFPNLQQVKNLKPNAFPGF